MQSRVIGVIVMVAVLQMMAARDGYSARILTADETTGRPGGDLTSAFDSVHGPACATANEDTTACFGTAYPVDPSFLTPAAAANGAVVGVNLCDSLANCRLDGRDPNNTISDQLYLQVGAAVGAAQPTLRWCWDSDLQGAGAEGAPGGINICQDTTLGGIAVPSANLFTVLEPPAGFIDLTSFFAGPNGPLAGGGVWQIVAQSEVPEPASLAILAVSLLGMGVALRRSRK